MQHVQSVMAEQYTKATMINIHCMSIRLYMSDKFMHARYRPIGGDDSGISTSLFEMVAI